MSDISADTDLDEDEFDFELGLTFKGAACPGCGEPHEPGTCPTCGAQVPPTDEVSEEALARQRALASLVAEASQTLGAFDALGPGTIPVATDQFVRALQDADVFEQVARMPQLGLRLAEFDLNDPKSIGGPARQAVEGKLAEVTELLAVCQELAAFSPHGPSTELREIAIAAGRRGAAIVESLLRILTASTISDARAAQADMQEQLSGFPEGERLDALLPHTTLSARCSPTAATASCVTPRATRNTGGIPTRNGCATSGPARSGPSTSWSSGFDGS